MSFVFISHASPDKAKIRPIVEALVAQGQKVWLDKPEAMGFSREWIEANIHQRHLPAGRSWRSEINKAAVEAQLILVCWSQYAREDRNVWLHEANLADAHDKMVACRIDDVALKSLPEHFSSLHVVDAQPGDGAEGRLQVLLKHVADRLNEQRFRAAPTRRRDPFTPYLIDRSDQEDEIEAAIREVAHGGVRPFLVAGPENECLDEFRRRLNEHAVPNCLGAGRSWFQLMIEWPGKQSPDRFAGAYRHRLAKAIDPSMAPDDKAVARALARMGRPITAVSLLAPDQWQGDEPKRIAAWLAEWDRLHALEATISVIPILYLKLPEAEPGWERCPPGRAPRAQFSNEAIWRMACQMGRRTDETQAGFLAKLFSKPSTPTESSALNVPPMLHPVEDGHAEVWLERHFGDDGSNRDRIGALKRVLFTDPAVVACGCVTMRQFAEHMSEAFQTSSEEPTSLSP